MSIVLFAIIGSIIEAGVAYWICFGVYCFIILMRGIYEASKKLD